MPKRGQHEGSLTHRPDGRWEARVTLPDGTRKSFYAKTKGAALAKLRAAQADLAAGRRPPDRAKTLDAFLDGWLAAVEPHRRHNTARAYRGAVAHHIAPALGRVRLADLDVPAVQRFVAAEAARHKPSTVRLTLTVLRAALADAERWGLVARNVARLVPAPAADAHEPPVLSVEQARTFLAALEGHEDRALFVLAITTGLRKAELLGLRWQDVDLAEASLAVRQILVRGGRAAVFNPPKTRQSRRAVPLLAEAVAALKAQRAAVAAARLAAGPAWADHDLVFPGRDGRPRRLMQPNEALDPLCAQAGLPRLTFHDLRHCCASLLLALGVPERVVMALLGHANLGTTYRYLHVPDPVARAAVARLGDALAADGV